MAIELVYIVSAASRNRTELPLPDQSLPEVRVQREIVSTEESRELHLLTSAQLPDIVQGYKSGVRLIFLPRIDGVAKVCEILVVSIWRKYRHQPRNIGLTVVSNPEQRQPVRPNVKDAFTVELVLLTMLEPVKKSVSVGGLEGNPGFGTWTETRDKIGIPIVPGRGQERLKARAQSVGRSEVHRMISLADVESAPINLHALEGCGNQQVRVGVAIAMGIRRKIVRQ